MKPQRGEVWLLDLGLAGKIRPAQVLSVRYGESDRALITVVPHSTAIRGSAFEIPLAVGFLEPGAFLVQGISTYPVPRFLRRLGMLREEQLQHVTEGLRRWLGL